MSEDTVPPGASGAEGLPGARRGESAVMRRCLFLIGRQRSGTTVLGRAIASHPRIRDLREVMHPGRPHGFYAVLRDTLNENLREGAQDRWFGVLLKAVEQMAAETPHKLLLVDVKYAMALSFGVGFSGDRLESVFLRRLIERGGKAIHHVRRNKLALLTSRLVAHRTAQWRLTNDSEPAFEPVRFAPGKLLEQIRAEEAADAFFAAGLAGLPGRIDTVYEALFQPGGSFEPAPFGQLAALLEVPDKFDLAPRQAKQGRPLEEAIANYAEVAAEVRRLVDAGELRPAYLDYLAA